MIYRSTFWSLALAVLALAMVPQQAQAQFENKWLSVGSLHNWYSEIGSEAESQGFIGNQQDGMRWPGIYQVTDMQAWKGLWVGAQDVRGPDGTSYPYRVVHVGPRVTGAGEFFPVEFNLVMPFEQPSVLVDGVVTVPAAEMVVDEVDEETAAAAMIVNRVNTLLGLTMERRILQFSQPYHDNYHIIEYTFTNTGNTDEDDEIELPDQTLEDVYVFKQWRWAPTRETRYVIGSNPTGWGINTMIDVRGDGAGPEPGEEDLRAQYAWHGNFPPFTEYDNIGGPILPEAFTEVTPSYLQGDTLGRFGASQFVGAVTLHADASTTDDTDDPDQPTTTLWWSADDVIMSNNDAFNPDKMRQEYELMSSGHRTPSHAFEVEPSGLPGWIDPSGDPSLGTSGGHIAGNGYGPYTVAPGESFRIVVAEAADGLSREANRVLGLQFKESGADAGAPLTYQGETMTKNEWVFTGRDSLFQTFSRALANYRSGYAIPEAPRPPSSFEVTSGGDRIALSWEYPENAPSPGGFEIWRAQGQFDSTYTRIATLDGSARSYDDTDADDGQPVRGLDYYYYIQAVSDAPNQDGTGETPTGVALRSNRYYTQTYTPARLKRQQGLAMEEIRVVPNPMHVGAAESFRFGGGGTVDRLAFYEIPGFCRIEIFTELGERIASIDHNDGSGDEFWDLTTESRQVVASGVYIAVFTVTEDIPDPASPDGLLYERGQRAFRKFVVIR